MTKITENVYFHSNLYSEKNYKLHNANLKQFDNKTQIMNTNNYCQLINYC